MRLWRDPDFAGPCVLVLGMFDGVHRGHQALLMAGNALADKYDLPLNVCTFEPHPLQVLRPEIAPPLLTTLPERARLMASFGVDALCILHFDRQVAAEEPEEFLAMLEKVYQPRAMVCGFNYTFGKKGRGTAEMLRAWGDEHGCETVIVPAVELEGGTVSSTRIRGLLSEGDVQTAARLMGHWYSLSGRVEGGKQLGRTMGFPTANVELPARKALPAFGVYSCWLHTSRAIYPAVVNVGRHPTLPEGAVTVEAHVLDESLMLYGEKVRLDFLKFQRPERRFESKDDLQAQITRDADEARAFFASMV